MRNDQLRKSETTTITKLALPFPNLCLDAPDAPNTYELSTIKIENYSCGRACRFPLLGGADFSSLLLCGAAYTSSSFSLVVWHFVRGNTQNSKKKKKEKGNPTAMGASRLRAHPRRFPTIREVSQHRQLS